MTSQGMQGVIGVHIEQTPGVRSGKARIKGTRVTVADVVLWTEQGMCPDEIVTEFPQLSLADVHAGLAYYHDNRELINRQIKDSGEFVDRLRVGTIDAPSRSARGTEADIRPVTMPGFKTVRHSE